MTSITDQPTTWLVTGASRGLGLALVGHLLERGDRVVATTRSASRLRETLGTVAADRLHVVELDLVDAAAVQAAVGAAVERFGSLDVVVNNAGYGYLGAVEEASDADVSAMLDVQVRGSWNVLRAALPVLRAGDGGHVLTVSSILGLMAFPGWGLYCAGKYAVEGMSEALAAEVADHGIRVTIVEPGYFDTDFLRGSIALPDATTDAYPAIREMVDAHLAMPGSQPGDPAKAAAALVEIVRRGDGPLRQQLGTDASGLAEGAVQAMLADVVAGRALATTTDKA